MCVYVCVPQSAILNLMLAGVLWGANISAKFACAIVAVCTDIYMLNSEASCARVGGLFLPCWIVLTATLTLPTYLPSYLCSPLLDLPCVLSSRQKCVTCCNTAGVSGHKKEERSSQAELHGPNCCCGCGAAWWCLWSNTTVLNLSSDSYSYTYMNCMRTHLHMLTAGPTWPREVLLLGNNLHVCLFGGTVDPYAVLDPQKPSGCGCVTELERVKCACAYTSRVAGAHPAWCLQPDSGATQSPENCRVQGHTLLRKRRVGKAHNSTPGGVLIVEPLEQTVLM